jgi:hypothetical protein
MVTKTTNPDLVFGNHPLLSQLIYSPLYHDDMQRALRLGYTPEEIIDIYTDHFDTEGVKTYLGYDGRSNKIQEWKR